MRGVLFFTQIDYLAGVSKGGQTAGSTSRNASEMTDQEVRDAGKKAISERLAR